MADIELLPLPEWVKCDDLDGLTPEEVRAEMRHYARANLIPLQAKNERLRAEVERLKSMTAATMGVGSGDGNLFVHGDYESIKAAQAIVLERDALRGALEEAEEAMRFVHASCATFPQEPQHIQNAAWRRIVNAIAKARAALAKESNND